jgi:hypothetical protein
MRNVLFFLVNLGWCALWAFGMHALFGTWWAATAALALSTMWGFFQAAVLKAR